MPKGEVMTLLAKHIYNDVFIQLMHCLTFVFPLFLLFAFLHEISDHKKPIKTKIKAIFFICIMVCLFKF